MPKIIALESARPMDGERWSVGQEISFNSGLIITAVKDASIEFDESVFIQFDIYVNDKLYKSIINMPVKVEYFLEN